MNEPCVFLRVVEVFTSDGIRDAAPGKTYPVPTVGITYLIEALGNEAVTNWISDESGDDILVNGRHFLRIFRGIGGARFVLDGVAFTLLHPDTTWPGLGDDLNEDSLVLLVEFGSFRALFPG